MEHTTRVLLVSRDDISLRALNASLEDERLQVVGEASAMRQGIEMAHALHPDVLVMDPGVMEDLDVRACRLLSMSSPHTNVLVLSSAPQIEGLRAATLAGVNGYVRKDTTPERLRAAVRATALGALVFDRPLLQSLVARLSHEAALPIPL